MADVEISYKGSTIASMSASGTLTLETEGKYCEDDITVDYTSPGGGQTKTLLASGTYTNANDLTSTQTMSIPVSYTGTPTEVFVNKTDAVVDTSKAQSTDWFCYYGAENTAKSVFGDGTLRTLRNLGTNNSRNYGYPLAFTLSADTISCRSQSSTYNIKAGTFAWYIWGYEA